MSNLSTKGAIIVRNLTVTFEGRNEVRAIEKLNFDVQSGEFICFLGASGCGKSTILNWLV